MTATKRDAAPHHDDIEALNEHTLNNAAERGYLATDK